jgi:hypothetical protein
VLRAKKRSRIPLRSQTNPNCAGNSNLRDWTEVMQLLANRQPSRTSNTEALEVIGYVWAALRYSSE